MTLSAEYQLCTVETLDEFEETAFSCVCREQGDEEMLDNRTRMKRVHLDLSL